jgi:hypothetical protein
VHRLGFEGIDRARPELVSPAATAAQQVELRVGDITGLRRLLEVFESLPRIERDHGRDSRDSRDSDRGTSPRP